MEQPEGAAVMEYGFYHPKHGYWQALADDAKAKRNTLLQRSDWTQIADVPVDQAAWAAYRQALRDITTQVGFPEQINWPEAPQ
jgi:hypothetical protein